MNKIILTGLCALLVTAGAARAQGTAFTYQGRLNQAGVPLNGTNDFIFGVMDSVTNGSLINGSIAVDDVPISNGLFTVTVDLGVGTFDGSPRWLQIHTRPGTNTGGYVELSPRQPITASPYAIRAANAGTATTATTANSVAAGAVSSTALANGVVDSSKIADGSIAASDLSFAVRSNTFWRLAGNAGTAPGVNFVGTTDGQPLRIQAPSVGINTATPRGPLEVNTGAGSIIFVNDDGYAPGITVSNSPSEGVLRLRHRIEVFPNPSGTESGVVNVRNAGGGVGVYLPGSGDAYFTGGNVGIGTSTPAHALLDVEGVIRLNNHDLMLGAFSETGSGLGTRQNFAGQFVNGVALYGHAGGVLGTQFDENNLNNSRYSLLWNNLGNVFVNSNLFVNTSVGIGTNAPQQQLSVAGGVNIDQAGANNGSIAGGLRFGSFSGEGIGSKRTTGGNQYGLDFYTAGFNRMTILNNGNVGINTNSPQATLDVNGSFRINQGTVFTRVQAGIFSVGTSGGVSKSVTNAFPRVFNTMPTVTATPVCEAGTDYADVFCLTIRRVTTTNFVVNFYRVDTAGGWAQNPRVSYQAWE
ncbi:MAG: hypothetical protein H7Y43_10635 [Akkermansiaceae bacterium]|nr:hypothetical protein [Verrucomicrobiales bacterium]